jgi:multiple sugar transport system permease protein
MSVDTVDAAPEAATGDPPPKKRRFGGRGIPLLGFLGPFCALFILLYLVPIGYALYKSFFVTEREGVFGAPNEVFGGLDNYDRAIHDTDFLRSIGRVLLFGVVQVPIMLIAALLFALLLDSIYVRMKRFFRLSYFVPFAVPVVIGAIMWGFLYTPDLSPVIEILGKINVTIDFLGEGTVLWSIANIVTWTYTGYNMLIIFSALQAIDSSVYEAARIDGASEWKVAWYIKVPIVRPALILTAVFSIIGTLQLFTEPQVLRNSSTAITSQYTPNLVAFTEASANNFNYAAALAFLLAMATAVLSFGFLKLTQRGDE